jgi:hypothetical protein
LVYGGLSLALVSALADGLLDLANAIGTATNITTVGIAAGLAVATVGRVRSPASRIRRR